MHFRALADITLIMVTLVYNLVLLHFVSTPTCILLDLFNHNKHKYHHRMSPKPCNCANALLVPMYFYVNDVKYRNSVNWKG